MLITADDVHRVGIEIMHAVADEQDALGEDHRDIADAWAKGVGLEEGCMAGVCNGITNAFEQAMINAIQDGEGEECVVDGEQGMSLSPEALTFAIEMTVISAFRWGFETARQFPPVVPK